MARARPFRRLITIPISHYCEKARWALERAGLDYREERHVQGIHRIHARRAGGGGTVPVLVTPEGVFAESEDILDYADGHTPRDRRLFPQAPAQREEVLALCRELDDGLGPHGRRLMYANMLEEPELMLRFNCQGVPAWETRAMTSLWPLAARWGKREMDIHPGAAEQSEAQSRRAFDGIAARMADGRKYLCGDGFTAADLTFASLAAAVVVSPRYGVSLPQPDVMPPHIAALVNSFREHPAGQYALRLIAEER